MRILLVVLLGEAIYSQNPVLDGLRQGIILGGMVQAQRTNEAEQRRIEAETRTLELKIEKLREQNQRKAEEMKRPNPLVPIVPGIDTAADQLAVKYADFAQVLPAIYESNERLKAGQLPLVQHLEIWYFGVKYALRTNLESDRLLIADFPDMSNTDSALFKKSVELFTREVNIDPGAVKNPRVLRLCVELAKAML